jgi:hypothetical protein
MRGSSNVLAGLALAIVGCTDPECGPGTRRLGAACIPIDAGRPAEASGVGAEVEEPNEMGAHLPDAGAKPRPRPHPLRA